MKLKPTLISNAQAAVRLLSIYAGHVLRIRIIEDVLGGKNGNCESLYIEALPELILDMLGVPKDNTSDYDFEEINRTGIHPTDMFCRDWLMMEMDDCVENPRKIQKFPALVRREMDKVYKRKSK